MRLFLYNMLRLIVVVVICGAICTACNSDKNLKKGDQYFAIGEYYEASLEYAKAYAKTPANQKEKRGEIAYKVAESNRKMNYFAKAQAGYRNAARYKYTDTLTYFYLAEMERYNKEYKQAAKDYQLYLDAHPRHRLSMLGLQSCATAQEMKERGSSYTVKEDKNFNSNYADYSPAFNGDDVYFSSTRRDCNGDNVNGVTGMKSGDIFYLQKDDKGKWKRYEAVDEKVNSKYDEGACAFTPDGKTMYFTRCRWDASYPRFAEIYSSQRTDAAWGEAKACELVKDTMSSYAHPAISPKGDYIYFVSDMPGGYGGLDLWRATLNGSTFGPVENLGPDINTEADEEFPTFRPNGDLYFSSKGRGGMGGLDIYKATQDSATQKWAVEHLPYPVNSNGDDFGMTFSGELNQGFFSSNRANRRGWDKIYSFYCPEILQSVKGWVYEQDGYELPTATVYMVGDDGTNKKVTLHLDGSFEEPIKPNVNYLFLATCEGYMNYKQELRVQPVLETQEYVLQFPLPSLDIPVLVRNVFYEFGKANITPQSIPALEGLVGLLRQNPSISIELSSHCDYRGSDEFNDKLSQDRAQSVVDYLTTHGIEKDRVVAKGYGKRKPKVITKKFAERYPFLNEKDTLTENYIKTFNAEQQDSCNALNRRTEFSVLKTTYGLFDSKGNLDTAAVKKNAPKDSVKVTPPAKESVKPIEKPAEKSDTTQVTPKKDDKAVANKPADKKETKEVAPKEVKTDSVPSNKEVVPKQEVKKVVATKDSVVSKKDVPEKSVKPATNEKQKTDSKESNTSKKEVTTKSTTPAAKTQDATTPKNETETKSQTKPKSSRITLKAKKSGDTSKKPTESSPAKQDAKSNESESNGSR